ncbi:hypothetical protein P43SY_008491 [Pythium insidiosum]|uniref:Protein kinase domain-containing protein n=1 Tax=Pythium insidiosum TaxID=114742 RepID=A0AAD5MC10_PYTIN|nr:hypothetical protein P43SY_008491 [Pythium insidiosum]
MLMVLDAHAAAPTSAPPLRIDVPATGLPSTVYIRMKDLPSTVPVEVAPTLATVRDLIMRFHEATFRKSYAAFAAHSALLLMRHGREVPLRSLAELRDGEVLRYRPCDELRVLVEQGCITPVLQSHQSHVTPAPTTSPCVKRKGRCPSVANNHERVQRYAPILAHSEMSPREQELLTGRLLAGDDQVVDAMEQFAVSRNVAALRRTLHGPSGVGKSPSVESLSVNFSTMEMQSPAGVPVFNPHAQGSTYVNPFLAVAEMMPMPDEHESNPFLVAPPVKPPSPSPPLYNNARGSLSGLESPVDPSTTRPSLMFDESALTENAPSVFLHSIKEKLTPPSRMSLSLEELDATFDELIPTLFSVEALLDHAVPVGHNFHERYAVGRVLGSGKYSVVKECQHVQTGARFAVKIIDKRQMMEVRFLKRELEIMHGLRHDGVVQLIELFESNEELFLVMELCSRELFEYIDRNGPLEEPVAQRLIARLVATVAYLHDKCIVHRDIKPENILIRGADVSDIKLTDFGIARKLEGGSNCTLTPHESLTEVATLHDQALNLNAAVRNRMARAHTKCGTRDYVAPEVMSGKGYGAEADLWSVGVVTYVLLSGCAPVFLPGPDGTKKVFFTEDCWHEVSDEVKRFIEALLVRNPEERMSAEQALEHPWLRGISTNL